MTTLAPVVATDLTPRQLRLLIAVATYWCGNGFSPSIRDLMVPGGNRRYPVASTSVVDYNLHRLERSGLLTRWRKINRTIVLTPEGWQVSGVTRPCCKREPRQAPLRVGP